MTLDFIFRLVHCSSEDVSFNSICLNVLEGIKQLLYYLLYNYQRTLEETGKRGQETYYLKSCLQLSCCLAFHRLFECTGIKVCLITSILVKPSSSRTLLVQTPQLTFVSRNRIPDISLHSSSPYDKGPHPR